MEAYLLMYGCVSLNMSTFNRVMPRTSSSSFLESWTRLAYMFQDPVSVCFTLAANYRTLDDSPWTRTSPRHSTSREGTDVLRYVRLYSAIWDIYFVCIAWEASHAPQMYHPHRRRPAAAGERETPSIWDSSEAWAACAKALRDYDEDMIQDWKEEIDTLLVFVSCPSPSMLRRPLTSQCSPRIMTGRSVLCCADGIQHRGVPASPAATGRLRDRHPDADLGAAEQLHH